MQMSKHEAAPTAKMAVAEAIPDEPLTADEMRAELRQHPLTRSELIELGEDGVALWLLGTVEGRRAFTQYILDSCRDLIEQQLRPAAVWANTPEAQEVQRRVVHMADVFAAVFNHPTLTIHEKRQRIEQNYAALTSARLIGLGDPEKISRDIALAEAYLDRLRDQHLAQRNGARPPNGPAAA
jgi:hypothetical protein